MTVATTTPRWLGLVICAGLGFAPAVAYGQSTQSMSPSVAAQMEVRIQQLEGQVRSLTGQVEELSYKLNQLERRYERSQSDMEMRMQSDVPVSSGPSIDDGPVVIPAEEGSRNGGSTLVLQQGNVAPGGAAPVGRPQSSAGQGAPSGSVASSVTRPTSGPTPIAALPKGAPAEDYNNAYALLLREDYSGAERAFRSFLANHPDDPLAGNAQYWLGETYYVREDYQQAAVHFAEGYQNYPDGKKAPANLLKLGMSLGRLGRKGEACASFDELERKFPDAPGNVQQYARTERQRFSCG